MQRTYPSVDALMRAKQFEHVEVWDPGREAAFASYDVGRRPERVQDRLLRRFDGCGEKLVECAG